MAQQIAEALQQANLLSMNKEEGPAEAGRMIRNMPGKSINCSTCLLLASFLQSCTSAWEQGQFVERLLQSAISNNGLLNY